MTCARLMATPLAARMSAPRRSRKTIWRSNSTTVTLVQCSVWDGRRPRFFGRVRSLLSTRGMKISSPVLPIRRDLPGVRVAINLPHHAAGAQLDGMQFNSYVINSSAASERGLIVKQERCCRKCDSATGGMLDTCEQFASQLVVRTSSFRTRVLDQRDAVRRCLGGARILRDFGAKDAARVVGPDDVHDLPRR